MHVSGKDRDRTLNLHRFSRDGIKLLGHFRSADGTRLSIAPDLKESLAAADRAALEFMQGVDRFIENADLNPPDDDEPALRDGYQAPVITELDLDSAGIRTIVWATGYSFDSPGSGSQSLTGLATRYSGEVSGPRQGCISWVSRGYIPSSRACWPGWETM